MRLAILIFLLLLASATTSLLIAVTIDAINKMRNTANPAIDTAAKSLGGGINASAYEIYTTSTNLLNLLDILLFIAIIAALIGGFTYIRRR